MTKRNERTSARVAKIAANVLASPCGGDAIAAWVHGAPPRPIYWRDVRALAASCLTQSPDKPKRAPAKRSPAK